MHSFRRAIETWDFDSLGELFTEDVIFRSPIVHKPYHGRQALDTILRAVGTVLEDLRYQRVFSDDTGAGHALMFDARIGELNIQGCDFLHTNDDGLIDEFTVMVRPLKAAQAFATKMGAALETAMSGNRVEGTIR